MTMEPVPRPSWFDIAEAWRSRLGRVPWLPGTRLPPNTEIGREFGVSKSRAQQAMASLAAEGFLVRVPGRGTFVAAKAAPPAVPRRIGILLDDDARRLPYYPHMASLLCDALAAEALRRMLEPARGRRASTARTETLAPRRQHILLPSSVRGVVERQSARPVAPAAALAERAAAFIRHNALKGINAADVAVHLGVSRALADLRFRQVFGESLLGMILRLRLDAAKRKLRETNLPIGQIVASCGFGSQSRAKHLFQERMGCSMREWRREHRDPPDE